jgi:hypothetical protein
VHLEVSFQLLGQLAVAPRAAEEEAGQAQEEGAQSPE